MFGGSGLVEMFKSDKKLTDHVSSNFLNKQSDVPIGPDRIGEQSGESVVSELV